MSEPKFYGVKTTGIVCRFGCPSKTPLPQNVRYFDSIEQATAQGFRCCKRCRPNESTMPNDSFHEYIITQFLSLTLIDPSKTIDEYAKQLAISRRQLERIIKSRMQTSPRKAISQEYQI